LLLIDATLSAFAEMSANTTREFQEYAWEVGATRHKFPVWAPFSVHLEPPLARIAAAADAPPELHIMPRILRINTSSFYG
jgi:hypothetical protein